jgi:hypothetical protein
MVKQSSQKNALWGFLLTGVVATAITLVVVFGSFSSSSNAALAPQSERKHEIVQVIQGSPSQMEPRYVERWTDDPDAYAAVVNILQTQPESGDDWKHAIDTVAILGGGNKSQGWRTLADLEKFSRDLCYFASDKRLPVKAESAEIGPAAAAAKAEVPLAIAMLAQAAKKRGLTELYDSAHAYLQHPSRWAGTEWTSSYYFGSDLARRNQWLAEQSNRALLAFK